MVFISVLICAVSGFISWRGDWSELRVQNWRAVVCSILTGHVPLVAIAPALGELCKLKGVLVLQLGTGKWVFSGYRYRFRGGCHIIGWERYRLGVPLCCRLGLAWRFWWDMSRLAGWHGVGGWVAFWCWCIGFT